MRDLFFVFKYLMIWFSHDVLEHSNFVDACISFLAPQQYSILLVLVLGQKQIWAPLCPLPFLDVFLEYSLKSTYLLNDALT